MLLIQYVASHGILRYFISPIICLKYDISLNCLIKLLLAFLLNRMDDFCLLIFGLDQTQYLSKHLNIVFVVVSITWLNKSISLVNDKSLSNRVLKCTLILWRLSSCSFLYNSLKSDLVQRINKRITESFLWRDYLIYVIIYFITIDKTVILGYKLYLPLKESLNFLTYTGHNSINIR